MIETAMFIALGFFAATLLALLVLPLASRRAARRAAAQLEDRLPLSQAEITAERDGIRALAAVEQRRLEQKLERAAAAVAVAESTLGRRTTDLDAAEQSRKAMQADRDGLSEALAQNRRALSEAESRCGAFEATVADLHRRLDETKEQHRRLTLERDEQTALGEERRVTIEALEARAAGLDARLRDRDAEIERSRAEQARLRASSNDYARDRDLARNELLLATTQHRMLQDDLKDLARRADDHGARLRAKSEALVTAERRLMEEAAERKAAEAALAELRRRFQLIEARLIEAGGQAAQTLVEADLDALRVSIVKVADAALQTLSDQPRNLSGAATAER